MNALVRLLSTCCVVVLFSGCPKNSTNPVGPDSGSGTISFGSISVVGGGSVGSNGGTIRITTGSLSGLHIDVPNGGYRSGAQFSISSAPINSHTFGSDFNVISPLIRVDNGGAYADSVMTLTIPCTVPLGHYAMAFFYDEETGELEGIPPVAINDSSLTVATRHFSSAKLSEGRKTPVIQGSKSWADLVVATMQTSKLFELQESGFRPGFDDWEFPNNGSYLASGGHCTGQSVTAMWYYAARKLALHEAQLNGRFNKNAPNIWQANRNGYRFASVVWDDQVSSRRNSWMSKFNAVGGTHFSHDSLHYLAFAYAIHMTKKPQLVEIWRPDGGHAMIVYRANMRVLSIADPNFPGSFSHLINLGANGSFAPYESKFSVKDPPTLFPEITYVAKSALFDFSSIGARYDEMLKGTIGDYPPSNFPSAVLQWYNGSSWVEVSDTILTDQDSISLAARCVGCASQYGDHLTLIEQLQENGQHVAYSDGNGILVVKLNESKSTLPIYVLGKHDENGWNYIDFKMPLVKKVTTAHFNYWLRGVDESGDSVSFGAKDGTSAYYGSWFGNTFRCDTTINITKNGTTYQVYEKLIAVCNASKTMVTSYTVELSLQGLSLVSLDGVNLPLKTSDQQSLTFALNGTETCGSLTRVKFDFWGTVSRWWCDNTSLVTMVLPK